MSKKTVTTEHNGVLLVAVKPIEENECAGCHLDRVDCEVADRICDQCCDMNCAGNDFIFVPAFDMSKSKTVDVPDVNGGLRAGMELLIQHEELMIELIDDDMVMEDWDELFDRTSRMKALTDAIAELNEF